MSTSASNDGKVVQLKERTAAREAKAKPMGELLGRVCQTVISRLETVARDVFDNVDDVLFDLAEKAASNASQVEFFDGMRELRKSRPLIERKFRANIDQSFVEFARGNSVAEAMPGARGPSAENLTLVDERELEETLAIAGMVAKAEGRLSRSLFAVNQRLAMINGGAAVESQDSPLGPTAVGHAFRQAMADVQVQLQIKLITYKLFERFATSALEKLYDEVNADLVGRGVLPNVPASHSAGSKSAGDARVADDRPGETLVSHAAERLQPGFGTSQSRGNVELSVEMFDSLRDLLAQRHATVHTSSARENSVSLADTHELLRTLSSLQQQFNSRADLQSMGVSEASSLIRQVKQNLFDQVSRQGGADARPRAVSSADEDTIDLVGMLFEFILSDRNLPAQFQAILGRLQIPYLKVAVLDKHLFAQASHPARRLLDTLARAGLSWSEESDPGNRLLDKANMVVERILTEFVDDLEIFESERADFEHFMNLYRKRSDVAEQRAAETARGKEKLSVARRLAADEMLKRIDGRQLPPIVLDILARPWANYLVLTLLRNGEDSPEWRNGLRFADELVWSALPKESSRDAERLQRLLPQLETALRHGLSTIASHDDDIHRTLDDLSSFYMAALAGAPVALKSVREVVGESPIDAAGSRGVGAEASFDGSQPSPVEEAIRSVDSDAAVVELAPAMAEDDPFLIQARGFKSGAWFEFKLPEDDFERAKLSWISPFTSNFLFVNRRGLKVCERGVEELARELRDGRTILLEQAPLFDRALGAVVARLRAEPIDSSMDAVLDA
ncbi:MAG: DUF1631 domain-containing protein [Dokdonella sp.]